MIKIGVHKKERLSGGPANFFQRLIDAINENEYAKIVGTGNLLKDISLYSSVANRINFGQYVVRIDGIYFDKNQTYGNNDALNKQIFKTIGSAKGVIFQTNFSKDLVEAHFGRIDIPKVNQIIMIRPTDSAIIFVQQLGRGLRKVDGKGYLTVIDVIGNYSNNYLIPIALYGDTSYNKDVLRRSISS